MQEDWDFPQLEIISNFGLHELFVFGETCSPKYNSWHGEALLSLNLFSKVCVYSCVCFWRERCY